MPIGIKQGMLAISLLRVLAGSSDQISGYDVAKAATHWTAGKKIFPMFVLLPIDQPWKVRDSQEIRN
jgi:hypothetical protein